LPGEQGKGNEIMKKLLATATLALTAAVAAPAAVGVTFGSHGVDRPYRNQRPYNPNTETVTSPVAKSALEIRELEGRIISLDEEERTLTIETVTGEIRTLGFMVPAGAEKIKATKKAAQTLGKKSMRFDELRRGTEVKTSYYAVLDSMETIVVTRPVLTEGTATAD
jgi:hypothetical protein